MNLPYNLNIADLNWEFLYYELLNQFQKNNRIYFLIYNFEKYILKIKFLVFWYLNVIHGMVEQEDQGANDHQCV